MTIKIGSHVTNKTSKYGAVYRVKGFTPSGERAICVHIGNKQGGRIEYLHRTSGENHQNVTDLIEEN